MTRMTMRTDLTGVVLCGGKSLRMGSDKGLIRESGQRWAERAAGLLQLFCQRVVYSVHPAQLEIYRSAIPGAGLIVDTENYAGKGPLGGLLSVHTHFPDSDILLVACDMPALESADIAPLLKAKGDAVAYARDGFFEPLCALYSAAACRHLLRLAGSAEYGMSLQQLLRGIAATALVPADPRRLRSRNTPVPA